MTTEDEYPCLAVRDIDAVLLRDVIPDQLWAKVARVDISNVGTAWAGHPVGFSLLTDGDRQYVAYYDTNRQMVVASRAVDGAHWTQQSLPQTVGWDSHNFVW